MSILFIIYGLILVIFMFAIANLSDKIDKLQQQVNNDKSLLSMVADDVYKDKG